MKQIIVMCAAMLLGAAIFDMISGSQEDSVLNTVKTVWEKEIELQKQYP